jgi:hypothetical protein
MINIEILETYFKEYLDNLEEVSKIAEEHRYVCECSDDGFGQQLKDAMDECNYINNKIRFAREVLADMKEYVKGSKAKEYDVGTVGWFWDYDDDYKVLDVLDACEPDVYSYAAQSRHEWFEFFEPMQESELHSKEHFAGRKKV